MKAGCTKRPGRTLTVVALATMLGCATLPLTAQVAEETNGTDTATAPPLEQEQPNEAVGGAETVEPEEGADSPRAQSRSGAADASAPAGTGPGNATRMKPVTLRLPPELAEIVRLALSGTSDDELVNRISEQEGDYTLTPEQIAYLRDLGISDRVIQALPAPSGVVAGRTAERELREDDAVRERDRDTNRVPRQVDVPDGGYAAAAPHYQQNYQQNYSSYGYASGSGWGSFSLFDGALSPYGDWYDLPGYGLCWQPLVGKMNPHWRPYHTNGQWVWTDAGWFWKSGYSWGWAPFHYGRWFKSPHYGWVWHPDRQWGPAWVSWRKAPNHVGWAPLPPGAVFDVSGKRWLHQGRPVGSRHDFGLPATAYTFVPFAQFTQKFRSSPYAPATLVKPRIFDESVVYNDIIVGPNQMIINRGVEPRLIQLATGVPIVPVPVQDLAYKRGGWDGHDKRGDWDRHDRGVIWDRHDNLPPTGWHGGRPGRGHDGDGERDRERPRHPGQPNQPGQPGSGGPNLPPAPTLPPQPGSTPYGGGRSIPERGPMSGYEQASDQPNWVPGPGGYVSPRGWTPPGFNPQAPQRQTAPGAAGTRAAPAFPGGAPAGVPTLGNAPMAPAAPIAPAAPAAPPANGGGAAGGGSGQ